MAEQPKVAGRVPVMEDLDKGKTYKWCACGRSENQPYCDGSHEGTGITPVEFVAEKTGKKAICMCKKTSNPPYCDGTHRTLL
jgi:CDGSH-type Zn-finger protein